ncbi:MAG: glycosyl hydrolase [Polyangiaceae bacterium]|jgi:hypothetical protein
MRARLGRVTDIPKQASLWLLSLFALVCGGCQASAHGSGVKSRGVDNDSSLPAPDADIAGPWVSDADNGSDSSSGSSVADADKGGDDAGAGFSGTDASRPPSDGSPEAEGEAVDGAASETGAHSDASGSDAGGRTPFKGVAGSDCAELVSLNVSWWYDWEQGPTGCTSTPFVPMVWGHANEQTAAGIASEVSAGVTAGYAYVLGFNEPDNASQSNIPVATAISLWPSFNNPSVLIGSPATQGNATGLTWIQDFMTQVNADTTGKLRVDFIATHWYGWDTGACDPAANTLESWIAGIEAIPGNRPIWLTEWGCDNDSNPNAATVEAFYAGALAMFAKHPRVVRYAWYQWETYNELVNADGGALTTLGTAYTDAPAFH